MVEVKYNTPVGADHEPDQPRETFLAKQNYGLHVGGVRC